MDNKIWLKVNRSSRCHILRDLLLLLPLLHYFTSTGYGNNQLQELLRGMSSSVCVQNWISKSSIKIFLPRNDDRSLLLLLCPLPLLPWNIINASTVHMGGWGLMMLLLQQKRKCVDAHSPVPFSYRGAIDRSNKVFFTSLRAIICVVVVLDLGPLKAAARWTKEREVRGEWSRVEY